MQLSLKPFVTDPQNIKGREATCMLFYPSYLVFVTRELLTVDQKDGFNFGVHFHGHIFYALSNVAEKFCKEMMVQEIIKKGVKLPELHQKAQLANGSLSN